VFNIDFVQHKKKILKMNYSVNYDTHYASDYGMREMRSFDGGLGASTTGTGS